MKYDNQNKFLMMLKVSSSMQNCRIFLDIIEKRAYHRVLMKSGNINIDDIPSLYKISEILLFTLNKR